MAEVSCCSCAVGRLIELLDSIRRTLDVGWLFCAKIGTCNKVEHDLVVN